MVSLRHPEEEPDQDTRPASPTSPHLHHSLYGQVTHAEYRYLEVPLFVDFNTFEFSQFICNSYQYRIYIGRSEVS